MNYLVDTHVLLWLLWGDNALGPIAKAALLDTENSLIVSYLSIVEIVIKSGTGKMEYDDSLHGYIEKLGASITYPDRDCFRLYKIFNSKNRDPFDNLLIAGAVQHKYTLATADTFILSTEVAGLRLLDCGK